MTEILLPLLQISESTALPLSFDNQQLKGSCFMKMDVLLENQVTVKSGGV